MSGSSGVGGTQPPSGEPSGLGDLSGLGGTLDIHTGVSTLSQLHDVLVASMGKKKGEKMYHQFITTMVTQMMQQVQQSAQEAQKAAQKMREDTSS